MHFREPALFDADDEKMGGKKHRLCCCVLERILRSFLHSGRLS